MRRSANVLWRRRASSVAAGGRTDLLTNEQPQPPGRRVELVGRHDVEVARAFGAPRHPSGISERLEMTADRGLRQLHDGAELRDGQLVTIEQQQDAAARRVGQRGQAIENCRRVGVHPYNPDV